MTPRCLVGVPLLPVVVAEVVSPSTRDHLQDRRGRTSSRTRSRARRAPARPSPRRRRSPSARSCRPRPRPARRSADASTNSPVGMPFFSIVASSASMMPPCLHSSMNAASAGLPARGMRGERVLGRDGAEGHAHDRVGARREDPHPAVADQLRRRSPRMSCGNAKRTPSLLPIQFSCIRRTRSGQPSGSRCAGRRRWRAAPRRTA